MSSTMRRQPIDNDTYVLARSVLQKPCYINETKGVLDDVIAPHL